MSRTTCRAPRDRAVLDFSKESRLLFMSLFVFVVFYMFVDFVDLQLPSSRVAGLGSLSSGAKMAMKIFVKRVLTKLTK